MASLDFEKEKNEFREYYSDKYELLKNAAKFFESLIASLIADGGTIESSAVSCRLKDREESIKKFSRKYQTQLEKEKTAYSIKDHITDLIGVRVVCYYESDIEKIVTILKNNFLLIEETNKSAELEKQENSFGYKGHHLDLRINEVRADLPEYKRYKEIRFEVQVRSIIQDAWSVLDHKIKYKKSIPTRLKRQINAMAALFEIADREFTQIRETTLLLESTPLALAQPEQPGQPEPILDVFSFLTTAKETFPDYQFNGYKSDGFVQEILRWKPDLTPSYLRDSLTKNIDKIKQYSDFQQQEKGNILNPFTQIRHALYMSDKDKFTLALYDIQRETFDSWLAIPDSTPDVTATAAA